MASVIAMFCRHENLWLGIKPEAQESAMGDDDQVWTWYEPEDPTPRHQCPCCDYISLPERGHYLICSVCFWEDDGVDIHQMDQYSGPNHCSLRQGRKNFREYGACDQAMVKNVCSPDERKAFAFKPRSV